MKLEDYLIHNESGKIYQVVGIGDGFISLYSIEHEKRPIKLMKNTDIVKLHYSKLDNIETVKILYSK